MALDGNAMQNKIKSRMQSRFQRKIGRGIPGMTTNPGAQMGPVGDGGAADDLSTLGKRISDQVHAKVDGLGARIVGNVQQHLTESLGPEHQAALQNALAKARERFKGVPGF